MSRKITITTLLFVVIVVVFTVLAVHSMDFNNRRQALQTSCRLFALMAEDGTPIDELRRRAGQEGFDLSVRSASGSSEEDTDEVCVVLLSDGKRELVLSTQNHTPVFAPLGHHVRTLLAGLIVASVSFAALMTWSVLRPVRVLTQAAKEISDGNFGRRVEHTSRDEIGELAVQFNAMAVRLQETIDELNARSAEMESIINAMRSGLIAVDEQMHVIRINPVARGMFEVYGDPKGKYVLDVTRNAKLESHLANAMEQGELYTVDLPVRIQRENRIIRLYITGLVQDNESIGALALIEDITELKRLENVRVDFVANVTHELKTPLTSISGFVETLQHGAIDDPDASMRFLSIISTEADRLSRLIDDILSISAMEAGRKQEEFKRIPLAAYTQQVFEMLQQTVRVKNIELKLIDNSEGAAVLASEDKLKQLLINLIDNALKYTHENGHVDVTVSIEGSKVHLDVKDDGIGIESQHFQRLFERFYRVDKGRSRSMGGTGLGLSIVKHILAELDGSIEVESEYGVGSVFKVTLPIARDEAAIEKLDDVEI